MMRGDGRRPGALLRATAALWPAPSRGIALVAVLWVTMLLAVLAASFASSGRTEARLARNQLENAKAEALADGGVHLAIDRLLALAPGASWPGAVLLPPVALGDGLLRIRVEDEDGKIDLNAAPVELLAGLLGAIGLEREAAAAMADRIADFRDDDATPLPAGAEDPDYRAAGLAGGAADRPFLAEVELLRVLGMTEDVFRRLQPYVTVHSGAEGVDLLRASDTVLLALPGMTRATIALLRSLDPEEDPFSVIDEPLLLQIEPFLLPSREIIYTIRALGESGGGGRFLREAVIELSAEPERPFLVHAWRRGLDPELLAP